MRICKFEGDVMVRNAESLVSEIVHGITNSQATFFIAPDGSKEGWADSNKADEARQEFMDWMLPNDNYCDYVEVRFGGDNEYEAIVRSQETDLAKE